MELQVLFISLQVLFNCGDVLWERGSAKKERRKAPICFVARLQFLPKFYIPHATPSS